MCFKEGIHAGEMTSNNRWQLVRSDEWQTLKGPLLRSYRDVNGWLVGRNLACKVTEPNIAHY